jgi:mersacidin/lichenicidin family type 2 lantibiotic
MSHSDVIRAWKDAEYRRGLSEAERAALPENPAGAIELTDADLDAVAGGTLLIKYGAVTCIYEFVSDFCCFTPFSAMEGCNFTVPAPLQPPIA